VIGKAVAVAALVAAVAVPGQAATSRFSLTSPAFVTGGRIPTAYTCDGAGTPVALRWTAPPSGTRSLALLVDDPDVSWGNFNHRVSWAIPATARSLVGAAPREGTNDAHRIGWIGPCPPSGTHRYFFRLYALRAPLRLAQGADRTAFLAALRGKVLATATLVGRFGR